jgi:hypothetical protein
MANKGVGQGRRPDYCVNREMVADVALSGCPEWVHDVFLVVSCHQGSVEECRFQVEENKVRKDISVVSICRRFICKFNNLYYEDGINLEGQANKMAEIEFIFRQGDKLYSHSIIKGSFQFAASNFETEEQEAEVYSKIYLEHMKQLISKHDRVLILNLLNLEHGIEHSEIVQLEAVIQNCPRNEIRYKYKNLVENRSSIVQNSLELVAELDPIFKGFRYNILDESNSVVQLQQGIIRVNCFDSGDVSDVYLTFHFLRILKLIFFSEATSFEVFAQNFTGASSVNVMAVRGMLANFFRRSNELLNCKESSAALALSTEMPLEFLILKERANKIVKTPTNAYNKITQQLIRNQSSLLADKFKVDAGNLAHDSKHFNSRLVRVMTVTWNVGGYKPPNYKEISSMFSTVGDDQPELIVVGLQEIYEMKASALGVILQISNTTSRTTRWKFLITQCLNAHSFYNLIYEDDLAGIQVLVFANSQIVEHIKSISSSKAKLGIMGMANKGAIIVELSIFDTPFKFATCHLNAGCTEKDTASRIEQINELLRGDFAKDVSFFKEERRLSIPVRRPELQAKPKQRRCSIYSRGVEKVTESE